MADLHLAKQSNGQHVQSGEEQDRGEDHQRAVLHKKIGMVKQLPLDQPSRDPEPAHDAEHAHGAEEMQRARKVTKQEADGDEIEEDSEGARDAVMGCAALAVHIADRYFDDRRAMPRGQRRDEAVQFAVERDLLQNLATIGLEGGAEVVDIDATELGHHPVGDA